MTQGEIIKRLIFMGIEPSERIARNILKLFELNVNYEKEEGAKALLQTFYTGVFAKEEARTVLEIVPRNIAKRLSLIEGTPTCKIVENISELNL